MTIICNIPCSPKPQTNWLRFKDGTPLYNNCRCCHVKNSKYLKTYLVFSVYLVLGTRY